MLDPDAANAAESGARQLLVVSFKTIVSSSVSKRHTLTFLQFMARSIEVGSGCVHESEEAGTCMRPASSDADECLITLVFRTHTTVGKLMPIRLLKGTKVSGLLYRGRLKWLVQVGLGRSELL